MIFKTCRVCLILKPLEDLVKDKSISDGRDTICRPCRSAQTSAWHERKRRQQGIAPREVLADEERRQRRVASYTGYARRNPALIREAVKKWRKENRNKYRALKANRRARETDADGFYSGDDVERIIIAQKRKCAACKCKISTNFHVDHISPLSKGGTNWPKNLQVLCVTCNVRKNAKTNEQFMREHFNALL